MHDAKSMRINRRKTLLRTLICAQSLLLVACFYILARITIDDAFITWRYGKNLVMNGWWSYNPWPADRVQAYTNPVFAWLSILPALLGMDCVQFFKLTSLLSLGCFSLLFVRSSANRTFATINLLMLLSAPSVMIHAFAGLETFAYVGSVGIMLIYLDARMYRCAVAAATVAMICRPEAWIWCALLPAFIAFRLRGRSSESGGSAAMLRLLRWIHHYRKTLGLCLIPSILVAAMLVSHYLMFGSALPNTYAVKGQSGTDFKASRFALMLLVSLAPLTITAASGRMTTTLCAGFFSGVVAFKYASSDLQMNYAGRFAFHIFMPNMIWAAHAASSEARHLSIIMSSSPNQIRRLGLRPLMSVVTACLITIFSLQSLNYSEIARLINYYPRLLSCHALIGQGLAADAAKDSPPRLVMSDAGMAAFRSGGISLDPVGLASGWVAKQGVTADILTSYDPEHVFLRARPPEGLLDRWGSAVILEWMSRNGFAEVGDIVWRPGYAHRYFSNNPSPHVVAAASKSEAVNNVSERAFLWRHVLQPPWHFWHE